VNGLFKKVLVSECHGASVEEPLLESRLIIPSKFEGAIDSEAQTNSVEKCQVFPQEAY
jgi:hypothetical protein